MLIQELIGREPEIVTLQEATVSPRRIDSRLRTAQSW
ncbi:MAG: hypothetical protein RLZZ292_3112 [Bacteroidota bacterium]|jgi:hypothetical protein